MPHLSVEYSSNLEEQTDLDVLCDRLREAILSTGLFEIGAVRVRAVRCDHYSIADRVSANAFADLVFRIGTGRTAEEKKRAGEAIFAAALDILAPLFERRNFALSLEVREIDRALSWKRNSMHDRLRDRNS